MQMMMAQMTAYGTNAGVAKFLLSPHAEHAGAQPVVDWRNAI